ncbi:MAG: tyrosine-type recombinase/integrase [Actinobacteria bacterium]|nr:tyrosine-type recombinase/integrase [Actinomycetota bacterium]
MKDFIEYFIDYITIEKGAAQSTVHKYRADLYRFKNFLLSNCHIMDFNNVELAHVRSYLAYLASSFNYQSSSMANKIIIIKHFLSFLAKSGYITKNPTEMIRTPQKSKKLPRALNEIELNKLLKAPEHVKNSRNIVRDRLILNLLAYTGVRRQELINLNWDDINLGENWLIIRKSKNKQSRIIPLHPKVIELLEAYLTQRLPLKDNALIIGTNGKRINKNILVDIFNNYLRISGVNNKHYSLHSLRHTFATQLLKRNANLISIQQLMGHKRIESTYIYMHVTSKELIESVNML